MKVLRSSRSENRADKFARYIRTSIKVGNAHLIYVTTGKKYKCIFCKVEFPCEASIAVHLTTLKHMGLPNADFQANPKFECNICGSDIDVSGIFKHACVEKAFRTYWTIVKYVNEQGSPNMCLLCRGKLFETPSHLNIHVLLSHSWKEFHKGSSTGVNTDKNSSNDGLVCPLCNSWFKTNDLTVLHLHAFEEHVPDFAIANLIEFSGFRRVKYGSETDMKQWLSKQAFSCNFPFSLVKRFPMTKCAKINRTMPAFKAINCSETFSSLITLTSHLCSHHFLEVHLDSDHKSSLSATTDHKSRVSAASGLLENELHINMIQKELDLKKRNLIERNVITEKIVASQYCLECFRLFTSNFELQIHLLVAHSNFLWNVCGICNYDCKCSLSMECDDTIQPIRTNNVLWKALTVHEQSHINFFNAILNNQRMEMSNDLFPSFLDDVKTILTPFNIIVPKESVEVPISKIEKPVFTAEEICHLSFIGRENKKAQTELIINESLNNNG